MITHCINISIVNHFRSFHNEYDLNTGKTLWILCCTVSRALCSHLRVIIVFILDRRSNKVLITTCSFLFFALIKGTITSSYFQTIKKITQEKRMSITAAGRQIKDNETIDPTANIIVFTYINWSPENSLIAYIPLFTLSIVSHEWLSVCRCIGKLATLWNIEVT